MPRASPPVRRSSLLLPLARRRSGVKLGEAAHRQLQASAQRAERDEIAAVLQIAGHLVLIADLARQRVVAREPHARVAADEPRGSAGRVLDAETELVEDAPARSRGGARSRRVGSARARMSRGAPYPCRGRSGRRRLAKILRIDRRVAVGQRGVGGVSERGHRRDVARRRDQQVGPRARRWACPPGWRVVGRVLLLGIGGAHREAARFERAHPFGEEATRDAYSRASRRSEPGAWRRRRLTSEPVTSVPLTSSFQGACMVHR